MEFVLYIPAFPDEFLGLSPQNNTTAFIGKLRLRMGIDFAEGFWLKSYHRIAIGDQSLADSCQKETSVIPLTADSQ
jgi:hypothetical protein